MKTFVLLLLSLVGAVLADRPETSEVIATFKKIAPMYKETLDQEEKALFALKSNVSSQLVNFHLDIIESKALFVNLVIEKEEYILNQIGLQSQDNSLCFGFVRTSSDMNVNLAGVSFTNCINTADTALNTKVAQYSGSLGNLATKLSQMRLLDVFKGDNIFYSPANITQKLNDKLAKLQKNPGITAKDIENLVNHVSQDLGAILNDYNGCMNNAYSLAEQGLNMCVSQLSLICGATLWPASCKPNSNEWRTECPYEFVSGSSERPGTTNDEALRFTSQRYWVEGQY